MPKRDHMERVHDAPNLRQPTHTRTIPLPSPRNWPLKPPERASQVSADPVERFPHASKPEDDPDRQPALRWHPPTPGTAPSSGPLARTGSWPKHTRPPLQQEDPFDHDHD